MVVQEAMTFIYAAGYEVVEVLEYRANGEVVILARRPVSSEVVERITTREHVCVRNF